jgi:hypothetical protein
VGKVHNGGIRSKPSCSVGLLGKHGQILQEIQRVAADVLMGHWGDFYPPKLVNTKPTKELAQDRFLARILLMGEQSSFWEVT